MMTLDRYKGMCVCGGVGEPLVLANWHKSVRRHSRNLCALPVPTLPFSPQYAPSLQLTTHTRYLSILAHRHYLAHGS